MTETFSDRCFLIVDDKPFLRNLLQGMLLRSRAGEVRHASHGAAAIDILNQPQGGGIDCLLCDWNMEPVNGLELLRTIRAGEVRAARDLPVVMLTGCGEERVVRNALELDAHGYLVKPVSHDRLVRALDAAFAKRLSLRPPEEYRRIPMVEMAPEAPAPSTIPPWVLLSEMRPATQREVSRILSEIRETGRESTILNVRRLDIDQIEPGKVLAQNVHAERGRLLLARGTVLNAALIGRLRELEALSGEAISLQVGDLEQRGEHD